MKYLIGSFKSFISKKALMKLKENGFLAKNSFYASKEAQVWLLALLLTQGINSNYIVEYVAEKKVPPTNISDLFLRH